MDQDLLAEMFAREASGQYFCPIGNPVADETGNYNFNSTIEHLAAVKAETRWRFAGWTECNLLRGPITTSQTSVDFGQCSTFLKRLFFFFSVASAVIDRGFHVISSLPRLPHTPPLSPPSTICIFFYYAPRPDSRILPTFFGKTLEISRDWRVPGLSGYHSLRFDCKNMSFLFLLGQAILAAIYYMSFFYGWYIDLRWGFFSASLVLLLLSGRTLSRFDGLPSFTTIYTITSGSLSGVPSSRRFARLLLLLLLTSPRWRDASGDQYYSLRQEEQRGAVGRVPKGHSIETSYSQTLGDIERDPKVSALQNGNPAPGCEDVAAVHAIRFSSFSFSYFFSVPVVVTVPLGDPHR